MERVSINRLPNGLTVCTFSDPNRSLAAASLLVRAGAIDERADYGVAHLLEHAVFSTEYFPTPLLNVAADSEGIDLNAYTSSAFTEFATSGSADALETMLRLIAEMVLRPLLEDSYIENERQIVLREYAQRLNSPVTLADRAMLPLLYGGRLASPVIGDKDSINGISADSVRSFWRANYVPNDAILVIVAPARHAAVLALAESMFGNWKPSPNAIQPSFIAANHKRRYATLETDSFGTAKILFTATSPTWNMCEASANDDVLNAAAAVLGSGMASRLFRLREESGLMYSVGAYYYRFPFGGRFAAGATVMPEDTGVAILRIWNELARIGREPVEDAELARAKRLLVTAAFGELERTSGIVDRLGGALLFGAELTKALQPQDAVAGIDPEQIKQAVQLLLPNMKLVVVGNKSAIDAANNAVAQLSW